MKKFGKLYNWLDTTLEKLEKYPKLQRMFKNTFLSTLETTTEMLEDGTTYVFTGDIPAMWLRDSSAQVIHYFHLINEDDDVKEMIKGLIEKQFFYINIDPYANAFNKEPNGHGHQTDLSDEMSPWVWERKFEIDSLAYPVWLLHRYYKMTKDASVFTDTVKKGIRRILETFEIEIDHTNRSNYFLFRPDRPADESIANEGKGFPMENIGLIWSGYRPSDDVCKYHYYIPGNAFAVVVLGNMLEMLDELELKDKSKYIEHMRNTIDDAIKKHGIIEHPEFGKMYAYEVDDKGNIHLMDDANIPSLLALPYLGYVDQADPIYQNTRNFILSKENPYYVEGSFAKGVGSPHTPEGYIWHIGLVSQALTTNSMKEKKELLHAVMTTDADTDVMHEGFDANDPYQFTREWFAWANSLFAHFIIKELDNIDKLMK